MYDVVYRDNANRHQLVATGVARDAACEVARSEARRRGVGRMFLAGSEQSPQGSVVLIVESGRRAA